MRSLLKAKPEPKKQRKRAVGIRKVPVKVRVKVTDKRSEAYDSSSFKNKLKMRKRGQRDKSTVLKNIGQVVEEPKQRDDPVIEKPVVEEVVGVERPKKKKKKKKIMKLTLGKVVEKGSQPTIEGEDKSNIETAVKTLRKAHEETTKSTILTAPNYELLIGDETIQERMPEPDPPIKIKNSTYFLNNREIFVNFINSIFEPYKGAIAEEGKEVSCETKTGRFKPLTHQEIVRDYINLYTPYRGLLIYHGLGSGKTCASIGIAESYANIGLAEGITAPVEIIVMTPASLRRNYVNDLKVCGDPLYRLNQYWEFIETNGNEELITTLSDALKLPVENIKKMGGAWFVNMKNEPNYQTLGTDEKKQLNDQINEMIRAKYRFIHYNGLRNSHLNELTQNGTINPFSNKVLIIDEAHNFVSRIVNKLKKPETLAMKLYNYIMAADNCRVVFLSGTPIINYPNELGVMFNMLRGFIKTYTFQLNDRPSESSLAQVIRKNGGLHDYITYSPSKKSLIITRNPFGFVNDYKSSKYKGVRFTQNGNLSDEDFVRILKGALRKNNISVNKVDVKFNKCLPDDLDNFKAKFINESEKVIKNENLLKKRILGLSSFFQSPKEDLMPSFNEDTDLIVMEIPMSDYQFEIYESAREKERELERRNARKLKRSGDDIYTDTVSTYRIFSRAFCNFVFPREIGRPMPNQDKEISDNVDEDDLDNIGLTERLDNVDGRFTQDDQDEISKNRKENTDISYDERIEIALRELDNRSEEFLSPEGLSVYSPKFLEIYRNINSPDNDGLHLIYSQFRTLEGIGILMLTLKQNGFAHFDLQKNSDGRWITTYPPEDEEKPKFALFTGTEDVEKKDIIRLIFNGDWDKIPTNLAEDLKSKFENNQNGEVIKVLMITSSGAEGINLKNTRFVHIVEPYWHPVRTEQVIGRARRICSHQELPLEKRNIKVFMYLMKFSEKQLIPASAGGTASKELLEKDVSKKDKKTVFSSDQALFEISNMKKEIANQLLLAIRESSIDCALHIKPNDPNPPRCMTFGSRDSSSFTYEPEMTVEANADVESKRNLKKVSWKGIKVTVSWYEKKRQFVFKPDRKGAKTGELYDLQSYVRAKKQGGNPILMGHIRIDERTGKPGVFPLN